MAIPDGSARPSNALNTTTMTATDLMANSAGMGKSRVLYRRNLEGGAAGLGLSP